MGCACGRHATKVIHNARISDEQVFNSAPNSDTQDPVTQWEPMTAPVPQRSRSRSNTLQLKQTRNLKAEDREQEGNSPRPQIIKPRFGLKLKEVVDTTLEKERMALIRANLSDLYEQALARRASS